MSIVVTADGFAEFCREHEHWLRRFIRRRMADPGLVDDVLQETLLRAYRARPLPGGGGLRPWLSVVAARACVDVWRREPPPARALDGVVDEPPAGPGTAVPGSDDHLTALARRRRINEAMAALSPRHRRVLELHAFVGLSYEAIAREDDVSVPCVTSVLGRARRRFAQHYGDAPAVLVVSGLVDGLRRRLARRQVWLASHVPEFAVASFAVGLAAVLSVPQANSQGSVSSGPATSSTTRAAGAGETTARAAVPSPSPPPHRGARAVPVPASRSDAARVASASATPPLHVDPEVRISPERSTAWIVLRAETPMGGHRVTVGVGVSCAQSAALHDACPVIREVPGAEEEPR